LGDRRSVLPHSKSFSARSVQGEQHDIDMYDTSFNDHQSAQKQPKQHKRQSSKAPPQSPPSSPLLDIDKINTMDPQVAKAYLQFQSKMHTNKCNLKAVRIQADAKVTTKTIKGMDGGLRRMESVHKLYMTPAKTARDSLSLSSSAPASSESSQGTTQSSANSQLSSSRHSTQHTPPYYCTDSPDQSFASKSEGGEFNVVLC
jgi:hypothetical protein